MERIEDEPTETLVTYLLDYRKMWDARIMPPRWALNVTMSTSGSLIPHPLKTILSTIQRELKRRTL